MLYHCGNKGEATALDSEQSGSEVAVLALKPRAAFLLIPKTTKLSHFFYLTAPVFDRVFEGKSFVRKMKSATIKEVKLSSKKKKVVFMNMIRSEHRQCQISVGSCCCTERFLDCPRNALLKEAKNSNSDFIIWACFS